MSTAKFKKPERKPEEIDFVNLLEQISVSNSETIVELEKQKYGQIGFIVFGAITLIACFWIYIPLFIISNL